MDVRKGTRVSPARRQSERSEEGGLSTEIEVAKIDPDHVRVY